MRVPALCIALILCTVSAFAQSDATPSPQKLFEAGQYDQAIQAIQAKRQPPAPSPAESYLAGQVFLRLNQNDNAKQEFARVTASADPVWKLVGESSRALVDNSLDPALDKIAQAAKLLEPVTPAANTGAAPSPSMPRAVEAFYVAYQTGLVKSRREDWTGAAEAFERAAQIGPAFAYAHYYAGLAYSRLRRPDKVALHFEHFLTVAPQAPERSAVMSIMRTIRGN